MKRTAIYVRVSTQNQDSERQKIELVNYCIKNKLDVKYIFEEKISGAADNRPEFNKLISLEDIDIVLVWELSRLSRKMTTLINTVENMSKKGICVISIQESFKSLDNNGVFTDEIKEKLYLNAFSAQKERELLKERVKSGRREKILSGKRTYTNQAPFGYDMSDGQLVINSDSEKVKEIFTMCKEGDTLDMISNLFNMSRAHIYKILTSEVYSGKMFSEAINDYVNTPQIIETELFNEVQELLKSNRRRFKKSANTSPFKGKIFCPFCGGMLSKHGGKYPNWQCRCGKTAIDDKYVNLSSEIALKQVSKMINFDIVRTDIENKLVKLYRQAANQSEYVDNIWDKMKVNDNDELKLQYQKESKMLQLTFSEIQMNEDSLREHKVDVSMIDRIEIEKIDKHHKVIVFHILDQVVKIYVDYVKSSNPILKLVG